MPEEEEMSVNVELSYEEAEEVLLNRCLKDTKEEREKTLAKNYEAGKHVVEHLKSEIEDLDKLLKEEEKEPTQKDKEELGKTTKEIALLTERLCNANPEKRKELLADSEFLDRYWKNMRDYCAVTEIIKRDDELKEAMEEYREKMATVESFLDRSLEAVEGYYKATTEEAELEDLKRFLILNAILNDMAPDLANKRKRIDACFEALLNARGLDKRQFTYDGEGSEEIEVATGKASKAEEEQAQSFLAHYDEKDKDEDDRYEAEMANLKKQCEEDLKELEENEPDLKEIHDRYVAGVRDMKHYLDRMKENEAIQQKSQKLEDVEKTATEEEFNNGIFNVEVTGETMAKTFKRMSDGGFPWSTEKSSREGLLLVLFDILIPDSISYGAGNVNIDSWSNLAKIVGDAVSGDFDMSNRQAVVDWINEHVVKFTCIANRNNDDYDLTLSDMVLTTK